MRTLIFVEFVDDIPAVVEILRRRPGEDCQAVALSPAAMEALEAAGISYDLPASPEDGPALDTIASENIERVRRLEDLLARAADAVAPHAKAVGFSPIRCHAHEILILLDAAAFRVHQLASVLRRLRPERVLYFRRERSLPSAVLFEPGSSIWSSITHHLRRHPGAAPWACDITWQELAGQGSPAREAARIRALNSRGLGPRVRVRRRLGEIRWLRRLYWRHSKRNLSRRRGPTSNRPGGATRSAFIIVGWGVDLTWIAEELCRRADVELWYWDELDPAPWSAHGPPPQRPIPMAPRLRGRRSVAPCGIVRPSAGS